MNNFKKILAFISLFALTGSVSAGAITTPITGSIGFGGAYTHDGTSLADAKTITPTNVSVSGVVTGSYADAGIVHGDSATYSAFTFNPITTPVANIWTVGSFSFELTTMEVRLQESDLLSLRGSGIVSSTDASLADAFGTWVFTANTGGGANFTWSSSSDVPAPGIALVMGMGLALIGLTGKARSKAV